jgi:thiol-disulfide isomerase/thioredoxin
MQTLMKVALATLAFAGGPRAQEGGDAKPAAPPPQAQADAKKAPAALGVGDTVPADVTLTDTAGAPFKFGDARGKVVVIHFWSIICPAEKAAEPKLMQMVDHFAGKDVVVVGIAANQAELGDKPEAQAFTLEDEAARPYADIRAKAAKVDFNHRILIDHGADVAKLLAAKSTPHCFVIDKKGVLVYSGALDDNMRGEAKTHYVRDAAEAALAGRAVEPATTKPYG